MTHDQLDDLVRDVPGHVRADPGAAWRRGGRRRVRARVVTAVGALAVVLVLSSLLGVLPRALEVQPADGGSGVDGYPVRIEKSWRIGTLPEAPGPLAGLLETETERGWVAVSPSGRVWELPHQSLARAVRPALTRDGERLAYLDEDDPTGPRWVVRDLLDGTEATYASFVSTRQRATFSPDGRRVLVVATIGDNALVLGPDGVEQVPGMPDRGLPVGWADDRTLVVLVRGPRPAVVLLGLDGAASAPVRIVPQIQGAIDADQQMNASLSPDGGTLAVRTDFDGSGVLVERFDVTTGRAGEDVRVDGSATDCQVVWDGDDVLVTTSSGNSGPAVLRAADPGSDKGRSVVVADPDLQAGCSVWAVDAVAGEPHAGLTGTLFGTSGLPFWWWWRDVLLTLAILLVLRVVPLGRILAGLRGSRGH